MIYIKSFLIGNLLAIWAVIAYYLIKSIIKDIKELIRLCKEDKEL